jgi:hypothetical protein
MHVVERVQISERMADESLCRTVGAEHASRVEMRDDSTRYAMPPKPEGTVTGIQLLRRGNAGKS